MREKNKVRFVAVGMILSLIIAGCAPKDADTGNAGGKENGENNIMTESNEVPAETGEHVAGDCNQLQPQADIEAVLAEYRAERQKSQSTIDGGYILAVQPNEENYAYGVGDTSYTARFDTKELNEAFQAAEDYIRNTLQITGAPVYACADPRMTAIYDDSDKGVAAGYDADNIFLCEYSDQGSWHYLILVRDGKGTDWTVLFQGDHYRTKEGDEQG